MQQVQWVDNTACPMCDRGQTLMVVRTVPSQPVTLDVNGYLLQFTPDGRAYLVCESCGFIAPGEVISRDVTSPV